MIRALVAILALTHTARADTCLQRYLGSINVSSSCDEYNCFDGAHINGFDISCTSGVSEAECAEICCSETNCMGFDYGASDHGWPASDMRGHCCTSYVSRFDGAFEHNGGTYRSCEKNSVTCSSPSLPPSAYIPTPSDPITECWIDVLTESHNGNECFEEKCPPLHNKGGKWCKLHDMANKKVCCGDDCCEPNVGAIVGVAIAIVTGVTLLITFSCYSGRCGCFRYRRNQLIATAHAMQRPQQPQVVYVQPTAPAQAFASV